MAGQLDGPRVQISMVTSSNENIFRVTGPFLRGIHRSPVNSPHKGQWFGALMFSLICGWINAWVNNCKAGDLIHHRAHYDVIVMVSFISSGDTCHVVLECNRSLGFSLILQLWVWPENRAPSLIVNSYVAYALRISGHAIPMWYRIPIYAKRTGSSVLIYAFLSNTYIKID